jgi:serine/threonine protein kinase/WD40 repeat protein
MPSSDSSRDALLERLAEEFVERHRRGERPALSEYADRHPDLAAEIRDLFPALVQIEHLKPVAGDLTGDFIRESGPADGHAPEHLGDYRILREVGHGGMGVVYEAEQESLGRHVALKVLPRQALLKATYLERFRREAKAAARLHHTNIVPVFGVGEADGVHYYAMQFIRGEALDRVLDDLRRLRAAPDTPTAASPPAEASVAHSLLTGHFAAPATPPIAEPAAPATPATAAEGAHGSSTLSAGGPEAHYFRGIARVGLQVADALAYAHRQGVLHRDIKPSNLLLDQEGTVWITDFGLAKAEGADDLTQTGDIVGTIRFMAPERFDGRSLPQSDVYALGVTLYEMLTLRPAFDDMNKARLVDRVLHEPPLPPRKLDPRIPRDLETVVLKCLGKDPLERYASAEAVAEDLRRFLTDRPIRARRTPWHERIWRWCRRNSVVASLLALVATLLTAIAIISTFSALHLTTALAQTQQAERNARLREAEALVGQAHGTRLSGRPGRRFEALDALKKAAAIGRELDQPPEWFDRLRNEAIAALTLTDVHITHSWEGLPPGTRLATLSDDFELYARTDEHGACSVLRVADDTVVARLPALEEQTNAVFGPGRLLGLHGLASGRWQLWDLAGAEPIRRLRTEGVYYFDFRPDGKLIALGHRDGSVSVYATDTAVCRYRLALKGITKNPDIRLHPTQPVVACSSYHTRTLQLLDLTSGAFLVSLTPWTAGGSGGCAWSPDGGTLAVSDGNGGPIHLYRFDVVARSLQLTRALLAPNNGGLGVQFNPAGDRLVGRGWNGIVHLLDVPTGRLLFSTFSLPTAGLELNRFDPTGKRLAAARVGAREERIGLWSVADGREYRALVHDGPGQPSGPLAIHPGGRLAARAFPDGVALFDLATDREVAFAATPLGGSSICFDGAGSLLTNSFVGFFRWPVRPDPARPDRLTIGPPERLPFHPGYFSIAASRDGKVIAQAMFNGYGMSPFAGGWVLHPNAPKPYRLEAGASINSAGVSPDGHWVAFGQHNVRVHVYEAATGRRVWQSAADGHDNFRFSQDGRWLVTANDGGRVYRVGTWESGPQLGPGIPRDISSDGRLVVMAMQDGIYRLVELATGRELAQLEEPTRSANPAFFTPDGTRLVTDAADGLRVWDLRRIRAELTKLGLDWDAPPYPDAGQADHSALDMIVNPGPAGLIRAHTERGNAHAEHARWDEAAGEYAALVQLQPDDHLLWYRYACLCLQRGDVAGHRRCCAALLERFAGTADASIAHRVALDCLLQPGAVSNLKLPAQLAERGVAAAPGDPWHLLTLGAAHYRAGRRAEAIDRLRGALNAARANPDYRYAGVLSRLFLAMAYHSAGQAERAVDWLDQAVQVIDLDLPRAGRDPLGDSWQGWIMCQVIRREAETMIGGQLKKPEK